VNGILSFVPFLAGSPQMPAFTGSYCDNAAGLYCTLSTAPTNVCMAFTPEGGACMYPRPCASGRCVTSAGDPTSGGAPGTCAAAAPTQSLPAGAACQTSADCASRNCDSHGVCSPVSRGQTLAQLALCTGI
jgi:hypothetical protein